MTDILLGALRLVETPLCQEAAAEIDRLKHDIERHIAICGTQEQEIARLTRERDALRAENTALGDRWNDISYERNDLRAALEIIAGKRQCVDNLMSNVEIARCALEQKVDNK